MAGISGNFVFGLTSIYRHASEIMHGTFFGVFIFNWYDIAI